MRVYLTFYRTVALPLIGISLICVHQVWQAQSLYFILQVFWVKVFTTLVIGVYIALFKSGQFVFFNNLGFSRTQIFLYVFLIDFLIWSLLMAITAKLI